MLVDAKPSFLKDLKKLPKKAQTEVKSIVENNIKIADSIVNIKQVKPMSGYKDFYRIRFGNYRIGFYHDKKKSTITLIAVADRRDIYKQFP